MNDEKQRELFEAWHGPHFLSSNNTPGSDLGGYQDRHTQTLWVAWQAALASQPKPAPVLLTDDELYTLYIKSGFMLTLDKDEFEEIADIIESAVLRKNGWGV